MAASIKYDSVELIGTTYIPRFMKHESAPMRETILMPIAKADGSVKVSSRYSTKVVKLQGIITGATQAALESQIDTMKELFSRQDKNLDVDWNGSTRRYVAYCESHDFDRDHFMERFCPWSATFIVPAGIGVDTSSTSIYDTSAITAAVTSFTTTYAGSAIPRPIFTIDMTTVGDAAVIKVENVTTGEYIKIDGPFTNADQIVIDSALLSVKKNGTAIAFRGLFPNWIVGNNSFRITFIGSGSTNDQSQLTDDGSRAVFYDNTGIPWGAQSFIPSESGYMEKLQVYVDKEGAPGGKMQFVIFSDSNNQPGANIAGNGYEIDAGDIGTSKALEDALWVSGTRPFLTAGTRYWLVLNPGVITGSDINNFFGWYYKAGLASYPTGKAMFRKTSSDPWQNGNANAQEALRGVPGDFEQTFRTVMGSGGGPSHSIRLRIDYTKRWL